MTFNKAAWAIDGPTINAALARVETFASTSGAAGLVQGPDLKVTAPTPAARGLVIAPGSAIIPNRYLLNEVDGVINQSYVVTNQGVHTITSGNMPAVSTSAQEFLVLVTIGDEEFSQDGHPWMTGSPIETPDTFTYVRPIVYGPVTAGATVESLNLPFPAYAIARLNIPANATNITSGMITDLRKLARPRTQTVIRTARWQAGSPTYPGLSGTMDTPFPWALASLTVPTWAKVAKIFGSADGMAHTEGLWRFAPYIHGVGFGDYTPAHYVGFTGTWERVSVSVGGTIDVSGIQGQTKEFGIAGQAEPGYDAYRTNMVADAYSSVKLLVLFEEEPS